MMTSKRLLPCLAALLLASPIASADTIAEWTFETSLPAELLALVSGSPISLPKLAPARPPVCMLATRLTARQWATDRPTRSVPPLGLWVTFISLPSARWVSKM